MKITTLTKIFIPLFLLLFFSCGDEDLDGFLEFQRIMTPVETENELKAAIADTSISVIGIVGNLNIELTDQQITRNLTITSFSGTTTIRPTLNNFAIFSIKDGGSLTLGDPWSKGTLILDGKELIGMLMPLIQLEGMPGTIKTLTMYDGVVLRDNRIASGSSGGGVNITGNGTFTMYGGIITGNLSTGNGGGVHVDAGGGSFTMYGGIISNNTANNVGGGVYLGNNSSAFFAMHGGTISNNTANVNGGGVHMDRGRFTMYGGTISGNFALGTNPNGNGGGVYLADNPSTFFTMQAPAIITGNAANNQGGGVYVPTNATFNKGTGIISGNSPNDVGP